MPTRIHAVHELRGQSVVVTGSLGTSDVDFVRGNNSQHMTSSIVSIVDIVMSPGGEAGSVSSDEC